LAEVSRRTAIEVNSDEEVTKPYGLVDAASDANTEAK
jgi:hypothetical protein